MIDVALVHVAAHRGAAADGTVATDAGHLDAAAAEEEVVADTLLVIAQESFAGIADMDAGVGLTALLDEVKDSTELRVGELQLGVVGGAAHREDAEKAPGRDA